MMIANKRILALCCSLILVTACAATPDNDETKEAADQVDQTNQPLMIGSSTSGGTDTGTLDPTAKSCMSTCAETHISMGWCGAYCECKAFGGSNYVCERKASERFIDI